MKVVPREVVFLITCLADQVVLTGCAHNPFSPTAINFKETYKSIIKCQELKLKPHEQKHSSLWIMLFWDISYLQSLCRGRWSLQLQSKHSYLEGQIVVLQLLTQHRQQESSFRQGVGCHPCLLAGWYFVLFALFEEEFVIRYFPKHL